MSTGHVDDGLLGIDDGIEFSETTSSVKTNQRSVRDVGTLYT